MAGPLIFDARDGETARLRRRVEALEKKIASVQKALDARLGQLSKEVKMLDHVQDEALDIGARNNRDLFERLSNVEAKVFPSLRHDLHELQRVVGPDSTKSYNTLDQRKSKPKP